MAPDVPPWEADRRLTLELARRFVAGRFPDVDSVSLELLGSGWEFDAFRTADGWVFRFPRRAEGSNLFDREARVHDLVADVVPERIALPRTERLAEPGFGFPYRVAGHRFIAGTPADRIDPHLLPALARDIGEFLGAIHGIPEADARAAGVGEMNFDDEHRQRWVRRCMDRLPSLRGNDPVLDRAVDWLLEQEMVVRRFAGPLRFIHHDLSPGHLIVDPGTGRLQGVLDWTDAILLDPVRDFVFLVTWRGWDFAEQVLRSYEPEVDDRFRERLRRSARVLSTLWIAEAHERAMDLAGPMRAVHHAFRDESM